MGKIMLIKFENKKSAKIAARLLSWQLNRLQGSSAKVNAQGKEVVIGISSAKPAIARATRFTAARLANILQSLDAV